MKPTASSTPSLSSNNTIEYNTIQHINTIFWRKKGWQLNYPLNWTPQKTAFFSCKNREWKEKQRRLNVPINPTNHCFASAIIDFHVRSLLLSYISLIYYHLLWYIPSVATHQPHTVITIASSVLQTTSIRFSIEDSGKRIPTKKVAWKKFDRLKKALTLRIENLAINLLQANECHFLDEIKRLNRTMGIFLGIATFSECLCLWVWNENDPQRFIEFAKFMCGPINRLIHILQSIAFFQIIWERKATANKKRWDAIKNMCTIPDLAHHE